MRVGMHLIEQTTSTGEAQMEQEAIDQSAAEFLSWSDRWPAFSGTRCKYQSSQSAQSSS